MQCLAKSPAERPSSASELGDRLEALKTAHPWTEAEAKAWWEAHRPPVSPHPKGGIGESGPTSKAIPVESEIPFKPDLGSGWRSPTRR